MSIEEVLNLFYDNKITLNEFISYLKPVITKIIDKYPLINFMEYDNLFVETLKECLNKYDGKEEFVKYYYNELNQIFKTIYNEKSSEDKLLTKDEFKMLFLKYKNGNIKARDEIIKYNRGLILSIANSFLSKCNSFKFDDLYQEGVIGVINALEKFDFDKGDNFSTYAVYHIRVQIQRSLLYNDSSIKIPLKIIWQMKGLEEAKQKLKTKFNREATIEEIALELNVTVEELSHYMLIKQNPLSLNDKSDDDDELELINTIRSDYDLEENVISNRAMEILNSLTEREQLIIKMFYGIGYNKKYTLEEIGQYLNMTKQAVDSIKKKIVIKLIQLGLTEKNNATTKLSTTLVKTKFNDYFLGINSEDLIKYIYALPEEYQNIIWEFYNGDFYLISSKTFVKEIFDFIIPYLFNIIYEIDNNGNVKPLMNNFSNIDREILDKKIQEMPLIIKRYGRDLNKLNPLTTNELKKLYYKELPSLYNFYLENKNINIYNIPLKIKYSSLNYSELVECIKKLTKKEQTIIYSIYGIELDRYNNDNLNIVIINKLYEIIKNYIVDKQKFDVSKNDSEVKIISKRKTLLEKYKDYDYITLFELIETLKEKDLIYYRYGYSLCEFNEINMINMKRIVKALNELENKMQELNNNEFVLKRKSLLEILNISKANLLSMTTFDEQNILYLVYDSDFNFAKTCPKKYIKSFNKIILSLIDKLNLKDKENKVIKALNKHEFKVKRMTLKDKFSKIDLNILHLFINHLYFDQYYIIYKVSGTDLNGFNKQYNLSFYYNTVNKLKKMINGQVTISSLKKNHIIKLIHDIDVNYNNLSNEIDPTYDNILIRDYIIYGLIEGIYNVNYSKNEISYMFEMDIKEVENIYYSVKMISNVNKLSLMRKK